MTNRVTGVSRGPSQPSDEPLTCGNSVSEGGLEPLAYFLAATADPWLRL
jgi:hypothetical protein